MRQIKIHSPVQDKPVSTADFAIFKSADIRQFQSLRWSLLIEGKNFKL